MTTWPSASTPWTWNTDLAMSRPIVLIACMLGSSNCGALTAHTFMALTCRWRSRPQHQKQTSRQNTLVILRAHFFKMRRPPTEAARGKLGTLLRHSAYWPSCHACHRRSHQHIHDIAEASHRKRLLQQGYLVMPCLKRVVVASDERKRNVHLQQPVGELRAVLPI